VTGRARAPRGHIDLDPAKGWLRRALPLLRAHLPIVAAAMAASVAASALQVAIPDVISRLVDGLLSRREIIAPLITLGVGLAVARFVIGYLYQRLLLQASADIEYDLRTLIYEHLTRLSFSFYDRVQSGQLISRANSDVRSVQMFLTFGPGITVQMLLFVFAVVVMVTMNVPLTLVVVATMPFVVVIGMRMRSLMFPISWVVQSRMADAAVIVNENVEGVRVVKSFAAEHQQLRLLARAARRIQWATVRQIDVQARWSPPMQNLPALGMAAVLLYGGWLILHHQLTIGELLAFSSYTLMMQVPMRQLGLLVMQYQRAAASSHRIYQMLEEQPDITERQGAADLVEPRGDVRFDHVGFAYGAGQPVLDDFSLRIRPGETVALVARTGAGKSTVARLLDRFYDVDDGAVSIDGHNVRDLTLHSLRHHVGLVVDEPFLFSISVNDNIAYGRPDASMEEVVAAARAACADEFISQLPEGYETVIGERGYTLSGGQRQRVALARALLLDPRILVLDDATSAIDVHIEQLIHANLRQYLGRRTTLVVAHRLSTISLADRVALMDGGRVVAQGTHAELVAREPRYVEVLAQVEADEQKRREGALAGDPGRDHPGGELQ
jgi:ATP-binding cassette subfamily B protein